MGAVQGNVIRTGKVGSMVQTSPAMRRPGGVRPISRSYRAEQMDSQFAAQPSINQASTILLDKEDDI